MSLLLPLANDVVQQPPRGEVHSFRRLVEHEQFGIVDERLSQGQPLQHPFAESSDRLAAAVGQADLLEQFLPRRRTTAAGCRESAP